MIGVARVYRVKQEIFLSDVTSCFNTLKKAVQDLHTFNTDAQLQMAQPSVRPDQVTMAPDPGAAFAMEFDHLLAEWDEQLQTTGAFNHDLDFEDSLGDADFDPNRSGRSPIPRSKTRLPSVSEIDRGRGDLHTLKETHDAFFPSSFDAGLNDPGFGGPLASSSQAGGFAFDDDFLEGIDVEGAIGDELARELGLSASPVQIPNMGIDHEIDPIASREFEDMDFNLDLGQMAEQPPSPVHHEENGSEQPPQSFTQEIAREEESIVVPLSPLNDPSVVMDVDAAVGVEKKKKKRVRLFLDARIELTNEELQRARTYYLEEQAKLREEQAQKKAEKESEKIIEEMLYGAPSGLRAPVLVDFWTENFRLQVEARSGQLHISTTGRQIVHNLYLMLTFGALAGETPKKRRKMGDHRMSGDPNEEIERTIDVDAGNNDHADPMAVDWDMPYGVEGDLGENQFINMQDEYALESRMRSSEEPGQARHASRPPSINGEFISAQRAGAISGSQRSAIFPWDNAGVSSSVVGGDLDFNIGSDRLSSVRRNRESIADSLSRRGSILRRTAASPGQFEQQGNYDEGNEYEFEVPQDSQVGISQASNVSVNLERHSNDFLEYVKMQLNAYPRQSSTLTFDEVVPKGTSTSHVAAAGFYHCLVLATKDVLSVKQDEPFGPVHIRVK
ncbi:hypothetical protein C8Q75DRAFT_768428 [Abortiporus biennis]|nr:hypothetical protein C8Q75DRAFT_768428 [Abortiporus biennis]